MIIGNLVKDEYVFPIEFWENYGFVCPKLITTNGDIFVIKNLIKEYKENGFNFIKTENYDSTLGEL